MILSGQKTKVHLGCLRLDYSSHYFVCALPTERQEALFECHLRGFAYLGGVLGRIRYDNLKVAVYKIMTGKRRQEQAAWTAFRSHFLFQGEYVTPGKGQEKGGVENLVWYVRRNFLVPLPAFRDYNELNAYLRDCCEQDARRRRRLGLFFDYDLIRKKRHEYVSATCLYPLWACHPEAPETRLATPEQAKGYEKK